MVTRPSAMVIASRPTMTGSMAATSAPNATTSTTSVSGSTGLAPLRVFGADGAHVVVQRRKAGHLHIETVGAGRPRQGVPDLVPQVGDDALVDVAREFRRQRGDQECGAPVLADKAGF